MNNKLCEKCCRQCKQTGAVTVLECRHFRPKPVQLEFKFKSAGKAVHAIKKTSALKKTADEERQGS